MAKKPRSAKATSKSPFDDAIVAATLDEAAAMGWREVTLDAHAIPDGNAGWWQRLVLHAPGKLENFDGTLWLDDLRHFPDKNPPAAASVAGLIGPAIREFGTNVSLFLDARNFTAKPAKVRARLTLTDRNESTAADREFQIELAPKEAKERSE